MESVITVKFNLTYFLTMFIMVISFEMILMLITFIPTLIMMVFSLIHVHEECKLIQYLIENKNTSAPAVILTDDKHKNDIEKLIVELRKRSGRRNNYQRHSLAYELNGIRRIKEINKTRKLNRNMHNENKLEASMNENNEQ